MSRYSRHIVLSEIGQAGQDKLSNANVLVVGAGGLGCPVLQYLTAAGIGTLGIIDHDTVETSNLQRQILFGTSSIGCNKAIAAKARLEDLNPTITIQTYPKKLTSHNALALFENYDIIVDGTDNFTARYLINDAAILKNRPVVYGAIYKFEGQVAVFNYQNGPSYRCLFPIPPEDGSVANCSEVGVLGVLPGVIGTMQANEVIKIVLGFDNVLSGKLFCYNSRNSETVMLNIPKLDIEFERVRSGRNTFENRVSEAICELSIPEISAEMAFQLDSVQFIDLREYHEKPSVAISNCVQIPLNNLEKRLDEIHSEKKIILFCQTGIRSKQAINILQKHNFNNCYSLKEGVSAILNQENK